MAARARWKPPAFALSDLDRQLLALCAPHPVLPPLWVHPEKMLERAAALDVFPLTFQRLRNSPRWLPDKISPTWEKRFLGNTARNLLLDNEQQRLLAALAAAGVRAVPLKGLRLAERAYGDMTLRSQVDIDLYAPPRQLPVALEQLRASGYERLAPADLPAEELARTGDEFTSECSLTKTIAGVPLLLELHWRLLPRADAELEAVLTPAAPAAPAGCQLPDELNFLYLCLHASADRWGTLKSLVDLAHWVVRQPPDWERVLAAAERLGLRRILYITLAVLLAYFDLPRLEPVQARLEAACPKRLPPLAVANPFSPAVSLTPAATHRLRLALRERLRDRVRYGLHLLRPTPADLAAVSLPRPLGFLHWGFRWLRVSGMLRTKLRTLREADWGVLLRCLWVIPAVEFSVRWRAPRHWLPPAAACGEPEAETPASAGAGEQIARWVDAAYRRCPVSPTCLTRSLVLYRLLRARGLPCRLQIGVRKAKANLQGHAWVEAGRPRPDAEGFEVILSY